MCEKSVKAKTGFAMFKLFWGKKYCLKRLSSSLLKQLHQNYLTCVSLFADLSDCVPHYLHHCGSDGVGTGLQAAVFTQEAAYIHRMQEHLLAVVSWREKHGRGGKR